VTRPLVTQDLVPVRRSDPSERATTRRTCRARAGPRSLSPARELHLNGITTLEQVVRHSRDELLAIHGVGPKAVRILEEALAAEGLGYKDS
jgi:predicted flap endonuclease-1-like 5' DNA nuclease